MISIPPNLTYRNLHTHLREPQEPVRIVGATGCAEIDVYALAGLRLLLDRRAAPAVMVDLPADRSVAARMLASGLLRDLRFTVRGYSPDPVDGFRGVPLTMLTAAADVERFAADVLSAARDAGSELAPKLCAAAAEAGDNAIRHSSSAAIAAMEIRAAAVDLVTVDAGIGIRATLGDKVDTDGDALLTATGSIGRRNGGLADIARRWSTVDGAELIVRSGHAGLVVAEGAAKHEEHGDPIQGTWVLIRIADKES